MLLGTARSREGHLPVDAVALGGAAVAPAESGTPGSPDVGLTIMRIEGGDDEEEAAPGGAQDEGDGGTQTVESFDGARGDRVSTALAGFYLPPGGTVRAPLRCVEATKKQEITLEFNFSPFSSNHTRRVIGMRGAINSQGYEPRTDPGSDPIRHE